MRQGHLIRERRAQSTGEHCLGILKYSMTSRGCFVSQCTFQGDRLHRHFPAPQRTLCEACARVSSQASPKKRVPTRRAILRTAIAALPLALISPVLSEEGGTATSEAKKEALQDIDPGTAEPAITDRVYFDLRLDGGAAERVTIGLYGEVTPSTVANFKALVRSGYVGTSVYRVVPGLTVQLGDVLKNGGRSGQAATADGSLELENVRVKHSIPGLVSMARGVDGKADSRFFVNTRPGDSGYLDGRYCAFGRVVDNMSFWYKVEQKAEKGIFASRLPKVEIVGAGVL